MRWYPRAGLSCAGRGTRSRIERAVRGRQRRWGGFGGVVAREEVLVPVQDRLCAYRQSEPAERPDGESVRRGREESSVVGGGLWAGRGRGRSRSAIWWCSAGNPSSSSRSLVSSRRGNADVVVTLGKPVGVAQVVVVPCRPTSPRTAADTREHWEPLCFARLQPAWMALLAGTGCWSRTSGVCRRDRPHRGGGPIPAQDRRPSDCSCR